jgi:hypothetical protein
MNWMKKLKMEKIALALLFVFIFATRLMAQDKEVITARGLARVRTPNLDQSLQIGREKARMRAEVALLAKLKRMKITSNVSVEDVLEKKDGQTIRKRTIKGTLRGSRILQEGRVSAGLYEVIVGIDLSQLRANLPPSLANKHYKRKYIDGQTKDWPKLPFRRRRNAQRRSNR